MELVWEDSPVPDAPFFSRDCYDKYSLAPSVRDLWAFLQRPEENVKMECETGAAKASLSLTTQEAAASKDDSCIMKEESRWDSCGSDDAEVCKDTLKSHSKPNQGTNETDISYPQPRLPFPCMSNLSDNEQKIYMNFLLRVCKKEPPQNLLQRVNSEVMQFTRYLQDVSRMCAEDYNFISQGAMQYSEDYFSNCLECIKVMPQRYQICELTSLTGGTFDPGLALTFEKQLLVMGKVDITDHKIVPADAQLASDYQSVSSENPPAKKAKDMHAGVSSDSNVENLCARYEPHVCLTGDALVRLLDNHGPEFGDRWELPIWVKGNHGKGSSQKKTVYIDPPLPKTEVTVRERSHIYHEESLKLSIIRNGSKPVFSLMTELPVNEQQENISKRQLMSPEKEGLSFEVDLVDLETFGETTPTIRTSKQQKKLGESERNGKSEKSSSKTTTSIGCHFEANNSFQKEVSSLSSVKDTTTKTSEPVVSVAHSKELDSAQESEEDPTITGDSDDERLVIDDLLTASPSPQHNPNPRSGSTHSPVSETPPINVASPEKAAMQSQKTKQVKAPVDQLGEILRMQTAMFSPANNPARCLTISLETIPTTQCLGPSGHPHSVSLVKPCVSSYLERAQTGETCTAPTGGSAPVVNTSTVEHKKILSQDLQAGAEDVEDYEAPEKGNLLYKLYSLKDMLLMVRSSVSLSHTRKVGCGVNQLVPVHVLPKLEYQLSYGVECLTSSEACQLWTETALHSANVSYIAHISAHTSKVALLRKLPDDWKHNISCGFKASKSLNILHHLLKKLTLLEEGKYLIIHKSGEPFVTLMKTADEKVSGGTYNLQQVHSSSPQPPPTGLLPWIPVDPAVVLPFHSKHFRVPCTFPPRPSQKAATGGPQPKNQRSGGKKKRKRQQVHRSVRRDNYMKRIIQKVES
ncbi:little elongation complex subunit 2 isoform 2-T3 [Aulostomus maculatus]